ncbi:MAG TPA: gamma-glutamyl-gamma-aminobutyrate hydrolase family protein [Egibacteraceae bacterium]|nr:gamma-glutamyl-gamma-aminobutyrate hydrolase family protein [Egibacteraceae bacterium]
MRRPVIGVTCYVEQARFGAWDLPAALVPLSYVRSVEAAGGRPLLIPPMADAVSETLGALDALVLTGGADVDPGRYGASPHSETTGLRPDRDSAEMALLAGALERDLPVLGICRGMQLLNVLRGGDLVQHLPEVGADRMHRDALGEFVTHPVHIDAASRLGGILGETALVHSHHHQGPGALGDGLAPVSWAPDGTVEAVEDSNGRFALGVLWHPEEDDSVSLFAALVASASRS